MLGGYCYAVVVVVVVFILVVLVVVVIFLWSPQKTAKDHHLNDAAAYVPQSVLAGSLQSSLLLLVKEGQPQHTQGVPSLGSVSPQPVCTMFVGLCTWSFKSDNGDNSSSECAPLQAFPVCTRMGCNLNN
jgi:hypothetical protein